MKTITLPAYSPELNPAERVFEEVRRWVEARVYVFHVPSPVSSRSYAPSLTGPTLATDT